MFIVMYVYLYTYISLIFHTPYYIRGIDRIDHINNSILQLLFFTYNIATRTPDLTIRILRLSVANS
jgi:hypothetical protein